MEVPNGPESLGALIKGRRAQKKPPAYPWQDLALRIIKELSIPEFKRAAVFKAVKESPPQRIEQALVDTKELCQTGAKWKYFFKVLGSKQP